MLRFYAMGGGVEIIKVASANIHGADAETHASCIDPVEIHQTLEGGLQRRSIIVAGPVRGSRRPRHRRQQTRNKKIGGAEQKDVHGSSLIDKLMSKHILEFNGFEIWNAYRRRADGLPEIAKSIHPLVRGVAGDDCRVDRAD